MLMLIEVHAFLNVELPFDVRIFIRAEGELCDPVGAAVAVTTGSRI